MSAMFLVVLLAAGILGSEAAAPDSFVGTPPWLAAPTGWEAVLAAPNEPGGRFVMEGRLVGPDGKSGMPGITLFVYHADRDGLYAKAKHHYMRLAGVLATDSRGRYRITSVLPGSYGGPPHVHFEAWGPGLPLRLWFVNLYRGSAEKPDSSWGRMTVHHGPLHPQRPGDVITRFDRPPPPEANVTRDAKGVFHAQCDLYWGLGFEAGTRADSVRRGLAAP